MANLDKMELQQLKKLEADVSKAILKAEKQNRRDLFNRLKSICEAEGLQIEEVVSEFARVSGRRKGVKRPPKYYNPENPRQTWSGASRKPTWFKEALERGLTEKEMLIVNREA